MEGIEFFETYALVVQWTTVQLILIIEVLLGLNSDQGDVTTEFIHADIPEDEKVYVKRSRRFEQFSKNEYKKCLKQKKILYGICQIPRAFWQYTKKKLEQSGLK